QIAAILAQAPPATEDAMAAYGRHLGTAFQLVDDMLDYQADAAQLGKNLGDDLAEGKPTLPLIHALKNGTQQQRALIRRAIEQGSTEDLQEITTAIETTGGLAYTARLARREVTLAIEALAGLPDSAHTQALRDLA